ncbi:MAG: arginase family protein [Hyphomonadaceae bacterium]|nr:arginase family protein [Hyphomonadaceae bacterium]
MPISGGSERVHGVNHWDSIFAQFRAAQRILTERAAARVLTAGGDCSVDLAVIDHLNGVHAGLHVVWIDAHLDANTPDTSPSASFHGMPVAAILGEGPAPMRDALRHPVSASRFHYHGVRVGDDGEWAFKAAHALGVLQVPTTLIGPVHIHFDLDVLNPDEFPHLAYPEAGGPGVDEAVALVAGIAAHADVVGLTITEFAPQSDDAARAGQAVIERICRAVAASDDP